MMSSKELVEAEILAPMAAARQYASLGHKLRKEQGIPVPYPLKQAAINSTKTILLLKAERQLIADELNIDVVYPILQDMPEDAVLVRVQEGEYVIEVDISKSEEQEARFQERKKAREEAIERKNKELNNGNT